VSVILITWRLYSYHWSGRKSFDNLLASAAAHSSIWLACLVDGKSGASDVKGEKIKWLKELENNMRKCRGNLIIRWGRIRWLLLEERVKRSMKTLEK
jgi:hypothetical protein